MRLPSLYADNDLYCLLYNADHLLLLAYMIL